MKLFKPVACAMLAAFTLPAMAGGDLLSNDTKGEISFVKNRKALPDAGYQMQLRHRIPWQNFLQQHGTWYVTFGEHNALPHKAFGKPIPTQGVSAENRAYNFISQQLADFDIPVAELELLTVNSNAKHTNVIFKQRHAGLEVLFSRVYVKLSNAGEVIMFGVDAYDDINLSPNPAGSEQTAKSNAQQGLPGVVQNVVANADLFYLAIPGNKEEMNYHLVREITVHTLDDRIPGQYKTLVDANTGVVLHRQNEIRFFNGECTHDHGHDNHEGCAHDNEAAMVIDLSLEGTVTHNPTAPTTSVEELGFAEVVVAGQTFYTDVNGNLSLPDNNPVNADFALQGLYCTIYNGASGTNQPSFSTTLNTGPVTVTWDNDALGTEISAYHGVNSIHDHMKAWTPAGFTQMDVPLTTRVDRTDGDCNAFYNGTSINFYANGGGCPATAYFNDVVFHEYGHGINYELYNYYGGNFGNGALGEGYADVWAFTLTNNAVLGEGFQGDPNSFVRRYDIDPKVYPEDLVGEVHADGEIIAGAWWDLGQDIGMNNMMAIYMGTQNAVLTEPDGQEGQLYTDILIEALTFDDDDNDITNGTPNGVAIVEHFDAHGITLLSNAEVDHNAVDWHVASMDIQIDADLILAFPWTYLDNLGLYYQINGGSTWNNIALSNGGGGTAFTGQIPAQPIGTVIPYYIGAVDLFGNTAGVVPFAADDDAQPNIPHFILVGYTQMAAEDLDLNSDFGNWEVGLPSDNATTGQWEINIPLGSFSDPNDPSTMVAPDHQHTPGGELAFITGRANTINDGVGVNDVDAGTTTLVSPSIDLSGYTNPTFTYYRWYINNPATGANPFADWWQVYVSDDDGANWTALEDTKRSDGSWRRFAFRVQDHVNITSSFKMKFHASDSIRAGQNLDGGSLIEAALDDIVLWENSDPNGVEALLEDAMGFSVYPNPASSMVNVDVTLPEADNVSIIVIDAVGQQVINESVGRVPAGRHRFDVGTSELAPGVYFVNLEVDGKRFVRKLNVQR